MSVITAIAVAVGVAGIAPLYNPCIDKTSPHAKLPWCDPTLPVDVRVKDMVSRMNISEKIANLDTQAPAIASLGLNEYNWWSEATHGLSHVNNSGAFDLMIMTQLLAAGLATPSLQSAMHMIANPSTKPRPQPTLVRANTT